MKFKVGDKVKVTKAVTDHRKKEVGKVYTVIDVNKRGLSYYSRKNVNYYSFSDNDTIYIFYEDELELVPFTKADLKDGMVAECRDGVRHMVLGGRLVGAETWMQIKELTDDLMYQNHEDLIIDKVYTTSGYNFNTLFSDNHLTLIWKREEPAKKMTVEEIEKELGYKVEIISKEN